MLKGTMSVDGAGHLVIGGCDAVELAHRYGTPLYVLDEHLVRQRAQDYREAFGKFVPGSQVLYAGKALLTTALCKIIAEEDLGLDVVSGGELYTALAAVFPSQRIYFHGNNKSHQELSMALDHRIGRIVIDSAWELEALQTLAASRGDIADILIRITPGVEPSTHSYIQTGQFDSKFGLPINAKDTLSTIVQASRMPNLRLRGLHCHIGSQIMGLEYFTKTVKIMVAFLAELRASAGLVLEELDLGGGLGITYLDQDEPPSPGDYAKAIGDAITTSCREHDLAVPRIAVEPGRSIVGEAGVTLYTVGAIKEVSGVRKYVAIDGGMADNPRVAIYGAKYTACLANKAAGEPIELVTIAGKCCESGDILIKDIMLPVVETGDILAVCSTGAYNYSMASNYNRLPRPAMVTVWHGESDIIVQRETYEDLIRLDRVPARLLENQPVLAGGQRGT